LKRWIDARRSHRYFVSNNAQWLEQEINLHIKYLAKTFKTDYETPRTVGKSGRRKMVSEESSEGTKVEKQRSFEKPGAFLN